MLLVYDGILHNYKTEMQIVHINSFCYILELYTLTFLLIFSWDYFISLYFYAAMTAFALHS